jgi:hypothetical protein
MSNFLAKTINGITPFGLIADIGKSILSRVFPDPVQQAEAALKLAELQQNGEFKALEADVALALAQIANNTEDARSGSNFRGGWRPFIGWVCGFGLTYQFLVRPLGNSFINFSHSIGWIQIQFQMDALDTATLMALISGMLGFGGLRTYERITGKEPK